MLNTDRTYSGPLHAGCDWNRDSEQIMSLQSFKITLRDICEMYFLNDVLVFTTQIMFGVLFKFFKYLKIFCMDLIHF